MKISGRPIDFGIYINADDIAKLLRSNKFIFSSYGLSKVDREDFVSTIIGSGLIGGSFGEKEFRRSFSLSGKVKLLLNVKKYDEQLAQILAEYLRRKLLDKNDKLSFETVFSHPSKIDFMREATSRGYKIYLYFISTESPEINVARIKDVRVPTGGHDVPKDKIISRYSRTMDLLYDAAQFTYQAYFFDNSQNPPDSQYFAHFKTAKGVKSWDIPENAAIPSWFFKYYIEKQ